MLVYIKTISCNHCCFLNESRLNDTLFSHSLLTVGPEKFAQTTHRKLEVHHYLVAKIIFVNFTILKTHNQIALVLALEGRNLCGN